MHYDLLVRLLADASLIPIVLLGAWALVFKVPKDFSGRGPLYLKCQKGSDMKRMFVLSWRD
jgi:hypothetical protein